MTPENTFMPHGHCYLWTPSVLWLHTLSDLLIALAYFIIPATLVYYLAKSKQPMPVPRLIVLFAGFIFWCGLSHIMQIINTWNSFYYMEGAVKAVTAMVSLATAAVLIPTIPKALQMRAPADDAAEERFRMAVEASPNAMVMIDEKGEIILVNRETEVLFGYSRSELIGKTVETLVPARFRDQHPGHRRGFGSNPTSRPMGAGRDLFGLKKDGSEFPVEIGLTPFETPAGIHVMSSIVDISERKKSEESLQRQKTELERSNRELEQFAYAVSHDLKAPLRAILNLSEWVEEDLEKKEMGQVTDNLGLMRSRVRRMNRLLDDLLEYSRVGRRREDPEVFHTRQIYNELRDLLPADKEIELELPEDDTVIRGYRAPFRQVLFNLVTNAAKHHDKEDGRVRVTCKKMQNHLEFAVDDDGPGIPLEQRERAFEMFQTLKPRDEVEGSGMGLALVKKIVENYGCKVWIEEKADRGCRICFTWPHSMEETSG